MHTDSTNFGTIYEAALKICPDGLALIDFETGEGVSYTVLNERVAQAGNAIEELGVGREDRIGLLFPNELEFIYAVFGAMRIGAVPVPVNIQVTQDNIDYIIEDSGAEVLLSSARPDVLRKATAATSKIDTVDLLAVAGNEPVPDIDDASCRSFLALMARSDHSLPAVAVDQEDPALQQYTSGSTGRPKGVVLSHGGIGWNTAVVRKTNFIEKDDTSIAAGPLYHKNAMVGTIKPFLQAGGTVVVQRGFDSVGFIEAIERYDVTYFPGVPAMFKMLIEDEESLAEHDVSSVQWANCGSASVPRALLDQFREVFGAEIGEGYGLTEGGPAVARTPRWGVKKLGSAGPALPGCETCVIDPETGEEMPVGETGELLVSNPGLGRYYNRPEANEKAFEKRNGRVYLHTGDLVKKDEDGYHYIVGRIDQMFIVGGENVYPAEIENLLQKHHEVTDAAVVPVPHATKGDAPVAFVVTNGSLTEEDLKTHALEMGPAYAHPRRVFFRDALPLSSTGKVDHDALIEQARELVNGGIG